MGEWYVVRGNSEESPVEILHATAALDEPTEFAADDFGAFFLEQVRAGLQLD